MSPRCSIGSVSIDFRAYGTFDANRAPVLSQDQHYLWKDQNELPLEPHHRVVPSGASKMISEPRVRLAQTMHLSCTDTNTISKQKEERFHTTHFSYGFHHMCPKLFPSLQHIRRKPCVYLASWLALSPNGPKWAFTWASSPRSTIGCVQNDLWAVGMLGTNCAAILYRHKHST
jgi:hypothetical protein